MLSISVLELAFMICVLLVVGGLVGYTVAVDRLRRAGGGKTPAVLRQELEDYRLGVTTHFQKTAELLNGLTEQYRAVHQHMAEGASRLCDASDDNATLAQLRAQTPSAAVLPQVLVPSATWQRTPAPAMGRAAAGRIDVGGGHQERPPDGAPVDDRPVSQAKEKPPGGPEGKFDSEC